jgi:hypothetical protein
MPLMQVRNRYAEPSRHSEEAQPTSQAFAIQRAG